MIMAPGKTEVYRAGGQARNTGRISVLSVQVEFLPFQEAWFLF
jgi:hypothetical protein